MPDLASTTSLLAALAEPSRLRLLCLLEQEELTVAELTLVTGLRQSRVSTHLGRLRDVGLVLDRRVGASTYYRLNDGGMPEHVRTAWASLRRELDDSVLAADRARKRAVLRARTDAAGWPDRVAGQMEHHYSPGRTWEATARGFLGLLELGDVLDVGSGDGVIASLVAPRARTLTCLDRSPRVVEAAAARLEGFTNVELVVGDMHDMPLPDQRFDQVLLFNVLTYAERPRDVVGEAFRVLRPGGTIAVITLDEHRHEDISSAYQHVNAGFSPPQLAELLEGAGFVVESCEISSRERRKPFFQVVTAFARRAESATKTTPRTRSTATSTPPAREISR